MQFERIKQLMREYAASTTAQTGLAFFDTETGASFMINGDKPQPTCSMFKIWLWLALCRMAERGEADLDAPWAFSEENKAAGSGILLALDAGFTMSMRNYAYLMMAYSDNTATDMIYRFVTRERMIRDVIEPLGLSGTKIEISCAELLDIAYASFAAEGELQNFGRPSYRMTPFYLGKTPNDMTTPADLVKTFRALLNGQILGPEWTNIAIDMMCRSETNTRIPRLLPGKKTLRIAHKTGSVDRVCNDAGILFTHKGAYILVLMYNGNTASKQEYLDAYARYKPDNEMAELSRAIYEAYTAD